MIEWLMGGPQKRRAESGSADPAYQTCRFAVKDGYDTYECRRRAPVSDKVEYHFDLRRWIPRWPLMKGEDWCGEYAGHFHQKKRVT